MFEEIKQYRSFQKRYHEYKDKIFNYLYYRLDYNRAIAEDLTSEVFLKGYEKFDTYNQEYAFSTWIYTIARNTLTDHFRRKRQAFALDDVKEVPDKDITEQAIQDQVDQGFANDKVQAALNNLPEFQKECVILKYSQGLKNKEIAEQTGKSEANVKKTLHRAITKLKSHFLLTILLLIYLT
jgi:RNA polymerase sigma factor (sigma-70 family)